MNTLHEIGARCGTDKARHAHNNISFLSRYEPFLTEKRNKDINILEIGVLRGASTKMWAEYFDKAQIIGIDIDPKCKTYQTDRVDILIGSQDDAEIQNTILKKYKELDFVLDDGSHVNQLTIASFNLYWPLLKSGGVYIIEDTHCTCVDLTEPSRHWPGMSFNRPDVQLDNTKVDFTQFVFNLYANMEQYRIYSINIFHGSIIIVKY